MAVAGYYDGAVVVPAKKMKKNQQVLIIPIDVFEDTGAGMLHQYAKNGTGKSCDDIMKKAAISRYESSKKPV